MFRRRLMLGKDDPLDLEIKACNIFLLHYPQYDWEKLMEMPASRFMVMAEDLQTFIKEQNSGVPKQSQNFETFRGSFPRNKK
jgi:hypothetical protein